MSLLQRCVSWLGLRVSDGDGHPIGKVEGVYVDRVDGSPRWLLVSIGRFGSGSILIPAAGAAAGNGVVVAAVPRPVALSSPRCTLSMSPLAACQERTLARHYHMWDRLRELSQVHDHVTSATPITNPRAHRVALAA
jgi:hypothetical protein